MRVCARDTAANTHPVKVHAHRGIVAYGPTDVHAAHADAKATGPWKVTAFYLRGASPRHAARSRVDLHERPIKVACCTNANGRRKERTVYSRLRARQAFKRRSRRRTKRGSTKHTIACLSHVIDTN